ncbi:protein-methionine sulfoxide oxidase mical3b isoform X3 [Electrophorus electricus]|uniref:protein-methionine sulfoxide oxidase mical3b isoform X3 n=1 Tax=Electrophorus electricus TaxID=8005 RepID=UPI0015D09000|nr:protein-methionine sulfoxide oxidase mical3b isoform X3 [Electrophorus electricus]
MGDRRAAVLAGQNRPYALFDSFVQACTCRETLQAFQQLCGELKLQAQGGLLFYHTLRSRLHYWRAKALWAKLDKRASQKEYQRGQICANNTCLIIGAGPCGLRTAVELSFLGARVVLVEKRDAFSRNNVLHLWPFTIHDLRSLGAKKFYGKFCAGAIDHISIRQLQLILLKVALLLGVEVHVNVEFRNLQEPLEDRDEQCIGWRAEVYPTTHPISELQFDVVIGADGRRNTLPGFHRKEFRGKLAIAITANFINRNTTAEAKVQEISGVAFIFNQKFFQELRQATGIDLENIVYYKDDTHYFVMTAKKQSLLEKGVILSDYTDTEMLLSRSNVDQNALLAYAQEAAAFSTNHQLPNLDFAINHYGQPDVAMFDFTCMYASENAALVRQRRGRPLLAALVGDSLLEPFWPMGTGIARGFLAAMDTAWMVRNWGLGSTPLEVLAERESVYRLLPQTTPENVSKNYNQYTLDPTTRYPNINTQLISPPQVCHLIDTDEGPLLGLSHFWASSLSRFTQQDSTAHSNKLLSWCQEQTRGYPGVCVTDLTTSWRSGLALCALIHRYRPDLIDFDSLEEGEAELIGQLALDAAEREFGISPIMTGQEMSVLKETDSLCMVMYLSQLHDLLEETAPSSESRSPDERPVLFAGTKSPVCLLNRLGQSLSRKRNPKDESEKKADGSGKRRRTSKTSQTEDDEVLPDADGDDTPVSTPGSESSIATVVCVNQSKVRSMANQLLAKFEENAPSASVSAIQRQMYTGGVSVLAELVAPQLQNQQSNPKPFLDCRELGSQRREFPLSVGGSDVCYFCARRVYVMERLSAEGKFFHRSCFQCNHCNTTLRLSNYAYDQLQGRFYCRQHFGYRLAGLAQRKRAAPAASPHPAQIPPGPPVAPLSSPRHTHALPPSESCGSASASPVAAWRRAKRPCGTPERIGLENCSSSPQEQDSLLQEVPEETQAQHNLSVSLQEEGNEEQSSSSESELEEEGEVLLETEEEPQAWTNRKAEIDNGAERKEDEQKREEDEDERGDEEHCKEEDVSEGEVWESSDEGEYCPWEREQHSGVWLEEEEVESRECGEHSDDPEVKPNTDRKVKSCDVQQQNVHSDESLVSESPPTPLTYPTRTSPPTSHQPGTPENSESEKSEVIVEFWLKSAEIRKSLGRTPVPRVSSPKSLDDSSTQTSIAGDMIYTSATRMPSISTAAPDYPSHPSHTSDTSSHSSGARSLSTCTCSMQTLSLTDLQRSRARSLNGTPSSSHIRTPDDVGGGEVEGAGPVLQEVADHCSVVHKLNITLQGHVTEKQGGLGSGPSSNSTTTNHNVLSTDSGLLTPPCSPPMARQRRDVHGLKPPPAGQMLVSSGSHAVPLNAGQQQRDRIKTGLERARSLPPDEVEVLCAGDANEELPSPATPAQLPRGIATVSSTPGLPAETHGPAPQPSGIDKSMLEGRAMPPEGGAEVQPGPEEKEKRRSLLFSPRKSKKGGSVIGAVQQEAGKHKSLWRSVFSGYKREKKRKEVEAQASASSDSGNLESSRRMPGLSGTTDLGFRRSLSFSEEADVSCTERCPLRMQKAGSEEELDEKLTRRVQRAARRQAKQEELRRLHRAQIIQRQLEQVEAKQRQLEEKGIAVEKALRGEAVEPFLGSPRRRPVSFCPCCSSEGMGKKDDPSLMQQWFKLVQEKNALVRYESELMIFAQELELEDRQSRLQQQLRERMAVDDHLKGEEELAEERRILGAMLEVVEQRDALVALLEEQRLQEREEDSDLEAVMLSKGFSLYWT